MKRVLRNNSDGLPQFTQVFLASDMGRLLRARRKNLGYTQEQIAAMMGCSPRLVGEMERGRGTVGIQKMLDYANGLGIDVVLEGRW